MRASHFLLLTLAVLLAGCSSSTSIEDFRLRDVRLPSGKEIKVEDLRNPTLMARGAMFRDSLAKDRGLLYAYAKPGRYSVWMYQTKMPLDTIWMDGSHTVVEVVDKMPPCPSTSAKDCPHFGGTKDAQFILQIAAGEAAKNGVAVGSEIKF